MANKATIPTTQPTINPVLENRQKIQYHQSRSTLASPQKCIASASKKQKIDRNLPNKTSAVMEPIDHNQTYAESSQKATKKMLDEQAEDLRRLGEAIPSLDINKIFTMLSRMIHPDRPILQPNQAVQQNRGPGQRDAQTCAEFQKNMNDLRTKESQLEKELEAINEEIINLIEVEYVPL